MENFRLKFSNYNQSLDDQLYKFIGNNLDQYENASDPYKGKTKANILAEGKFKRENLIDSMLSMKEVCCNLFDVVLNLSDKVVSKTPQLDKITDALETSFNKLSADLTKNLANAFIKPSQSATNDVDYPALNAEKHMVILANNDQSETNPKFSTTAWSDIVKTKLTTKLKNVPIEKTLLSKDGKGCIFLPTKKIQEEVKQALENDTDFSVTADSKPRKSVLPKLKIFNIDTGKYNDKNTLRSAILQKNSDINNIIN